MADTCPKSYGRDLRERAARRCIAAFASRSSTPTQICPSSSRTGKTVIGRVAGGLSGSPLPKSKTLPWHEQSSPSSVTFPLLRRQSRWLQ
ncbi:hypothetical protein BJF78_32930 [Pseudonocardia sp. CNS-139]|nr:hypothetical protein BJF78_32930 [Pseudonocardia sp. CNS-139]